MSEVKQISGRARRRPLPWLKKSEADRRQCSQGGCNDEGMYIPYVTVWSTNDPKHEGRFVIILFPLVFCSRHASTDVNDYKPDEQAMEHMRSQLRTEQDPSAEPDLATMRVQFVGNSRCSVDFALAEAQKLAGTFEPPKLSGARRVGELP
jgi:hypothetical protein